MTIKRNKPLPRSRRKDYTGDTRFAGIPSKDRRDEQIRRDDTVKNISIGLYDIEEVMQYYIKNVLDPFIMEQGNKIKVPVMYGNPERWVAAKKQGFYRDRKGKIISPLIMYRRTNVSPNDDIPIDDFNRNFVYTFEKKWSPRNRYDNFAKIINKKPTKERITVAIPDYITINYDGIIWTSYVEHMDKLIELFLFNEGKYWGKEDAFKFHTKIDSFDQSVEVSTGEDRIVKTNFSLTLKGYLVPEYYKDLINTQKIYTNQQLILDSETEVDIASFYQPKERAEKVTVTTGKRTTGTGDLSNTLTALINQTFNNLVNNYISYVRKQATYATSGSANITGSLGGNSVAWFRNVATASAPTNVTATNINDFIFFVNGAQIETGTYNIEQDGNDFKLTIATGSVGYELEATDEVVAFGKFN